jgi:hypothetical protein
MLEVEVTEVGVDVERNVSGFVMYVCKILICVSPESEYLT